MALEYAGGDRLFLPVENIELLSRYGHEEGLLDKLGGGAWQAKKARLKDRIRQIADRLMRVAAERLLRAAPVLEAAPHDWEAFSARFPYTETDDQQTAIDEVLGDLSAGRPMDRLVVGDVGFGKTEVAMRAAFVAVEAGVQVAVIAPTTLLARQHHKTFSDRFRGLPVTVRPLSRFVSQKDANATRAGLADGSVDIVIGTHAVLAKGVTFRNLGLLVIDEEQHFGVTHKERLKELRSEIHVLTLTATPIPRTLQLSLTGVRDLSIIGTPPVDRLAIRTYVSEFDTVTLREALLREHYRGGQSFYVAPRIADLPEIEEWLRDHVPEVSFMVAHGQMPAGELDDRMNAFYDGKYDVLLATSIVESGLDIPTANTMIVHRADMFGLAQLYQIRGRVGRSKARAYCYLTTKPRAPLTPQAQKRLRLLGSLDSLGAGFSLASQDLDLRGAGNILGEEQSGHITEVGYELYQAMLEETIDRLKSGDLSTPLDDGQWAPQINLGVPVLIPEAFVPDLDVRLGLYRRLASLTTKVELEGFAAELIDRFGPLPREVNTLLLVVRIKTMCRRAGIGKLDVGPKGVTVQFHQDKFANPGGLVEFIHAEKGAARVKDNKIIVARAWTTEAERIKGSFAIAKDLAEKAQAVAPPRRRRALRSAQRPAHQPQGQPRADQRPHHHRHRRAVEGEAKRRGDDDRADSGDRGQDRRRHARDMAHALEGEGIEVAVGEARQEEHAGRPDEEHREGGRAGDKPGLGQAESHHRKDHLQQIGADAHAAHPDLHHEAGIHDGGQGREGGDQGEPKRESRSAPVGVGEKLLDRREKAEHLAEPQRQNGGVDQHLPVGQNLARGAGDIQDGQRAAVPCGQRLGLADADPRATDQREDDEGKEHRAPVPDMDDRGPDGRGDSGHNHEDHHHEGRDPRHIAPGVKVADHRKADDARTGGPEALQDAGEQQQFQAGRLMRQHGPGDVKDKAAENRGLAAHGVRDRTGEERADAHPQDEGGQDQLRAVDVVGRKLARDLGQRGQHRVDGKGDGGEQHRQHRGEFWQAEAAGGGRGSGDVGHDLRVRSWIRR